MAVARRTILKHYNRACLDPARQPEAHAPIYMHTDDGDVLLEDFANGFFTAMLIDIEAWKSLFADPETDCPLALLLGHSTNTRGPTWIEQFNDPAVVETFADTWRAVPQFISFIHEASIPYRIDLPDLQP